MCFLKKEDRSLSPVAILSNKKYLDLMNGPKDHSWCFGYRCNKRLSTFTPLVTSDRSYDIFFSSTPPKQLRFRLLDATAPYKVRLAVYYFTSQRIDLYKNNKFVTPTNGAYNQDNEMIITEVNDLNRNSYMPKITNDSGTNFFDKSLSLMFFILDGSSVIDLKIAPVLFVKFGFPAVTPESFFSSNSLVANIANLLGVPASKIRRVNIVRAFKRNSNGNIELQIIIEDNAVTDLDNEDGTELASIQDIEAGIANRFATGQLQDEFRDKLNVTVAEMGVQEPGSADELKPLAKVSNIAIVQQVGNCAAQTPCHTQPILNVVDENVSGLCFLELI